MPASSAPQLLLFHGLASSAQEYGLIAHPMRRAGLRATALSVPGYSHGTPGLAQAGWQQWVRAAGMEVDRHREQHPGPVVLGGLCTGAMLATALVLERPTLAEGLVWLSPLVAYNGWGLPWWYHLRKVAYALGWSEHFAMREREPFGVKNMRMRTWVRTQLQGAALGAVGPASIGLQQVRESERLSAHVLARLDAVQLPVRAIHAREDEVCRLASVQRALAGLPKGQATLKVLENSYHMVTVDNDRAELVTHLADFIQHVGLASVTQADATRA